MACTPVPHSRLTLYPGASFGTPAFMPTTRPMYISPGSVWITFPNTTWSTRAGSIPARSSAATAAIAPRSLGGTAASDLP
jgi:hypothetical protein